ncbi:putative TRAM domain-containing protein [Seiridium cardinale]|uniref:TRAM domain-containing protein n=1 Tax=Seiridium cardinale TaxID=138064 RepID=A0ABR2XWV3_9PEZI
MASSAVLVKQETSSNGPHQQQGQQRAGGKRPFKQGGQSKKKARKRERDMKSGSHEEVLGLDIQALLASQRSSPPAESKVEVDAPAEETLPEEGSEIEIDVVELSSTGDGLAQQKSSKQVYVVPFTVPGDTIKVKVYRHMREGYTVADLISVVKPSPKRDDSRINCKYFAKCSGCQFQMLEYSEQLRLKRRIVEKAFRNFSQLPPELVPAIQDTIGSPLQYEYRTKLTPHFDGPKGWFKRKNVQPFESRPNVGFTPKGTTKTMDIEDCPIGTDAVRMGMQLERARMDVEYAKYVRGGTILLREDTKRVPKNTSPSRARSPSPENAIKVESETHIDYKTCITDNNGTSTEYIDDFVFTNSAGSFFQNNNSILPVFTEHIRQNVMPPKTEDSSSSKPIKYLIDAYSGSGLFTITLSSVFESSTGIDIDDKAIQAARKNAEANGLSASQANFISADARELFKTVSYPADETVVILDPPRKGCDANFLRQLLQFGPKRVVYVSCNVHTQARDVGMLVRGETGEEDGGATTPGQKKIRYDIESLRGFDFFPQTGHVEGLALLNRVEIDTTDAGGVADASITA